MTVKASKRKLLEKKGWKVGSTTDFLGLSEEEAAYIELKLSLSDSLKEARVREKLTQVDLAKLVQSSQSRVAKMEAGDPTVSIDALIKTLLALGVSRRQVAKAISRAA